jgi:hypothetical protein
MSVSKKPIAALIGVLAMLLAGLFFATASADAYPPGTPPTLSVSDTSPTCGETVTVSGSHYQPGETVTITQGGKSYTVTADSTGSFTTSITIVCIGTSPGAITATGSSSGDVASLTLTNGGNNGGNNNGGGNLSTTGVAVIGIGALGVVLLVGGGLLLLAGRRRNTSAA